MCKKNIVESNIGLVKSVVSKFVKNNIEDSELFSIGCEALMKAATSFDHKKAKFSTWATRIIYQKIIDELRKNKKNIKSCSLEESHLIDKKISNFPSHVVCSMIRESDSDSEKIVNLYYLEQKTLSEIAQQLDVSKEGVRKKIKKAIVSIRNKINLEEDF